VKQDYSMQCMRCFTHDALAAGGRSRKKKIHLLISNFWPEAVGSKYCKMTCHKMGQEILCAIRFFVFVFFCCCLYYSFNAFGSAARCFRRSTRYLLIGGELREIAEVHSECGAVWNRLF